MEAEISCDVYRSERHQDMYLYVPQADGLSRVPEALLVQFGEAVLALSFELTPDRPLAKEDPDQVYRNLAGNGYHLQMPPFKAGLAVADD